MAFTRWIHLLLLCLCSHHNIQFAACKPLWMSHKFPCDVTARNTSEVLFDCKGRHLDKLPHGITSNATGLDLSENLIHTIPVNGFSHLLNLTRLNLSWANKKRSVKIDDSAFKNLTKLHKLKLAGICLKGIPNNLPVSLEILDLHNNNIMGLNSSSFASLTNLTQLLLSRNCYMWNPCEKTIQIMDNTFAGMTKLKVLDLSFNNLSQVPQGLPQSVEILDLGSNKIQHIKRGDFQRLQNLKVLSIQGNCPRCHNAPFPCVPCPNVSLEIDLDAFKNLAQLENLNLGGNSLQFLNQSWFEKLNKLKKLSVSFNFLLKAITEEATFLRYLPSLEVINLSFNYALGFYPTTVNLSKEFSNLKSLKTLHMEGLVFQSLGPDTLKPLYKLKHLSTLNLGTNFIIHSDSTIFSKFHHLRTIYLAENRLYPTPDTKTQSQNSGYNQGSDFSISPIMKGHPKDFTYDITHGLIKQECFDCGRVLILSENNLFFISPKQFEGFGDIACLNLSGNGFSAALNGTEFSLLPNVTYLDLSFNKIDLAYDNAFKELQKLEVLDLSHNAHYFKAFGITHNLNFMTNLPVLRVLNMSHNSISSLTTKEMKSKSLAELKFTHNVLGTLWKERDGSYEKIFHNLSNLTDLDISQNHIGKIPMNVYGNLPRNLIKLCISHNFLTDFSWESLTFFHQLQILDLSFNSLSFMAGVNSNITQSLTFLDLSHNHIFDLETRLFTLPQSLQALSLSYNRLTTINQSTFQPEPQNLKTLLLQGNPFQCTCDSVDFFLWIANSNVKIPSLTTAVTCDTPENQRHIALISFDIMECVNDSQAFQLYILTTSSIIVFMFVATASHLFYWDASYMLHYMKAKLKGYRSLHSAHTVYDVFVTYDTKDPHVSEWVMTNLRVKLEEEEGEKYLPLCLEERDWPPGVPLVDNLTQSIQYSRKTMFVLTQGYVKTGAFKLAIYLAHQRLLDENVDVIVLLILEPVLQHSHFLRLRRRLCGRSVVEWPRTAAAEPWFWQNLRNVIRVDNQMMYNKTYSNYFTSK